MRNTDSSPEIKKKQIEIAGNENRDVKHIHFTWCDPEMNPIRRTLKYTCITYKKNKKKTY
jgi:hypothetical protein